MKVMSIPSVVPGWYDEARPNFSPPRSWKGAHVRVAVPVGSDPAKEMAAARLSAEKKYPGAVLHVVPDFQKTSLASDAVVGDDASVLQSYLSKLELPAGATVDMVVAYLQKFLPSAGLFGVQGLEFRRVVADDVLCFERVVLDLNLTGLTLVRGVNKDWDPTGSVSNGGGKSSLVGLPFLGMFGRTFKGQTHDEWARQQTKSPARIEQTIGLASGEELKIVRARRPGSLRVWVGKDEKTMGDANATQKLIELLTNLTWEVLTNSVYVGQREVGSVFGTEKERKELFSRLLGLDRFLDAQEKLRKAAAKRQREVEEWEADIGSVKSALMEAERSAEEVIEEFKSIPEVDARVLDAEERNAATLRAKIAQSDADMLAINAELDVNQKAFEGLLAKRIDAESRSETLRAQIEESSKIVSACPTCGSAVTVRSMERYVKRLTEKRDIVEEAVADWEEMERANRTVRKALIEKVQEKRAESTKIIRAIDVVEEATAVMREHAGARARLASLHAQRASRVEGLKKTEALLDRCRSFAVEERAFAEFCVRVVGRDGLPAHMCSVAVPHLNQAAARYGETFTSGEIGVTFSAEGGDVDVEVVNAHGGGTVKDQSSGEMRMAGIVAALSFRDVLVPHNLIVLDEPSEGLDGANAEAFARGLNAVVGRFRHCVVISHSERLVAALEPDRVWTVTKEGGVSTVSYS